MRNPFLRPIHIGQYVIRELNLTLIPSYARLAQVPVQSLIGDKIDLPLWKLHGALAASLSVCRIQLESVLCSLAFAALVNIFNSSSFSRTGTILPLAWPFGNFGLPIFLAFGMAFLLPVITHD
jgi:hypothetical protein